MQSRTVGLWSEVSDLVIGLSIISIADLGGTFQLILVGAILFAAIRLRRSWRLASSTPTDAPAAAFLPATVSVEPGHAVVANRRLRVLQRGGAAKMPHAPLALREGASPT